MTSSTVFLDNMVLFINSMRRAGIPVSSEQSIDVMSALKLINIGDRQQFYHTLRSVLVSHYEHLRLFDILYHRFWKQFEEPHANGSRQKAPHAPRHDRKHHRPLLISYMANKARETDPEIEVVDKANTFSAVEVLQRKDFSQLTEEEIQNIKRMIEAIRWKVSQRQTRRYIADKSGNRLHMRSVMRSAIRHGSVPIRLTWKSRKIKPRPIILIADISGSMEKYSRLVLQFFYCVSRSIGNVEAFVFGTRLTRITEALAVRNIDRALEQAGRDVVDWSGGTRIGESLQQFNQQWAKRVLRRGAITIIVSDGWERGDVDVLKREMRYLQHRSHRLVWLNPLSGKQHYAPEVSGMAAAMQHVDDFLPIHNLQSLTELAEHLQRLE